MSPGGGRPHPAVVRVIVPERGGAALGSGSLIGVSGSTGLVITNWHVVKTDRGNTIVAFPDGFKSKARILKTDKKWDLAALLIARPRVSPIRIAIQRPRQGERLTIAGYGSGKYRAARGVCSGYLSPAANHPAEMVEMTAVARQGDSGGPMLNDRGELAAVLFGAKQGTFSLFGSQRGFTAGSHVGRVRRFLAGTWPPANEHPDLIARKEVPRAPTARISGIVPEVPPTQRRQPSSISKVPSVHSATPKKPSRSKPVRRDFQRVRQQQPQPQRIPDPESVVEEPSVIHVQDLVGNSLFEQLKTILAAVGVVALMVHFVRRANL